MNFSKTTVLTALYLSVALLLSSCASSDGQKQVQTDVLLNAQRMGDHQAAIQAIHNLMAMYPDEAMWRDSLALTYFRARRYEQAYAASKVSLVGARHDRSEQLLRVAAESSKVLGMHDESLKLHLRLLEFTPDNPVLLYDIGLLYYSLLQLEVGIQYMDRVIALPTSSELQLMVRSEKGEQEVSYLVAALNAKGYGLTELQQFAEAEQALTRALEMNSGFENARSNMAYLQGRRKGAL